MCVGRAIVDQLEASVEEAINSATWVDLQVQSCNLFFIFSSKKQKYIHKCYEVISSRLANAPKQSVWGRCRNPVEWSAEGHECAVQCQASLHFCSQRKVHQRMPYFIWWHHAKESTEGKWSCPGIVHCTPCQGQKLTFPLRGNICPWKCFPGAFFPFVRALLLITLLNLCWFLCKILKCNQFNQSEYYSLLAIKYDKQQKPSLHWQEAAYDITFLFTLTQTV